MGDHGVSSVPLRYLSICFRVASLSHRAVSDQECASEDGEGGDIQNMYN